MRLVDRNKLCAESEASDRDIDFLGAHRREAVGFTLRR
jgi:hypothetical protein